MQGNTTSRNAPKVRKHPKQSLKGKPIRWSGIEGNTTARGTIGLPAISFASKEVLNVLEVFGSTEDINDVGKMHADLTAIYKKYCRLSGLTPVKLTLSKNDDIRRIHGHISKEIKKVNRRATINIEYDKEEQSFHFVVYSRYKHSMTVWIYPLHFLHILDEKGSKLYEPMVRFTHYFLHRLGFKSWRENNSLDYVIDMLNEHACELAHDDPAQALELIEEANIYGDDGIAAKYLEIIRKAPQSIDMRYLRRLKSMRLKGKELWFKRWMIQGITLLKEKGADRLANFSWRIDPDEDNEEGDLWDRDGDALDSERLYTILWNDSGGLGYQYLEGINQDTGEFGSYDPLEVVFITKRVNKPYAYEDWFDRCFGWMQAGYTKMYDMLPPAKKAPEEKELDARQQTIINSLLAERDYENIDY